MKTYKIGFGEYEGIKVPIKANNEKEAIEKASSMLYVLQEELE